MQTDRCRWTICLTILGLGSVAGCGGDSVEPVTAGGGQAAAAARSRSPQIDPDHPTVRVETNLGAMTIELDALSAPGTVRNFLNYISDEFYDGTLFHYVAEGKMIVGGGYGEDRRLQPVQGPIRNEAHNGLKNVRGSVAMAREAGHIDSATSQFFINLTDAPQRDHADDSPAGYGYCVFGKVVEGLDVADRISASPTGDFGGDLVQAPDPPVVIRSIRVIR